jgi:peptidoglycan/LPS O-acetylase OafA/YrhL
LGVRVPPSARTSLGGCTARHQLGRRQKIYISELLQKSQNNLGIFRLIAALFVVWGHAYPLTADEVGTDFVFAITGFEYSGGLAVKFFFFISGLLIGNSLLSGARPWDYVKARFFRIWPALAAFVMVFTFLIGPFITSRDLSNYLFSRETWNFVLSNLAASPALGSIRSSFTIWELPGIFQANFLNEVNGSLWTIPYEVLCYSSAFIVWYLIPRLRLVFLTATMGILLVQYFLPALAIVDSSRVLLMLLFYSGFTLSLAQSKIKIGLIVHIPLGVCALVLWGTVIGQFMFYLFVFVLVLQVSGLRIVRALRLPGDYSYGVYIWGWPLQQLLVMGGQISSTLANQILTMVLALAIGAVSWHLIEKPCIYFSKKSAH